MIHQLINSRVSHYSGIVYRGTNFFTHFHNSYELIYMLNGAASVIVGGHAFALTTGELLLISPCAMHEIQCGDTTEYFIAIIAPDYITDYAETHKNDIVIRFQLDDEARAIIRKKMIDTKMTSKYERKACFYLLLSFAEKGTVLLHSDAYDISFVYTVNAYIAEHFTECIRRQDLARITGYEAHYFSHLFRENFGTNIRNHLNLYRISHACQLIRTTDHSIADIALNSGFSSVRDFNIVFARLFGMTPTAYRASMKESD